MADHRHGLSILLGQRASDHGVDPEHRVIVAGHGLRQRQLGLAVHAGVRVEKRPERGESRERIVILAQIGSGART